MRRVRVLIVDDSAAVREGLIEILRGDPEIEVVGAASDPVQAVKYLRENVPDVITLDVEMPKMDGITFLKRIMAQHPIPVVMCSSLVKANSTTLMEALEAGAVEIICKPEMGARGFLKESADEICRIVKSASKARLGVAKSVRNDVVAKKLSADEMLPAPSGRAMSKTTEKIVALGASTGGTEAIRVYLQAMPADAPATVVVQHMPEAFTRSFAERLNHLCDVTVEEAKDGQRMLRGHVLIAPGGKHTMVTRKGAQYFVEVRDGPLVSRHKPSVDVLFRSVARNAGANAIGVILTGMGDDGAKGLLEMRQAGAATIGQDEASSVVYGMPKVAFETGAVMRQLPLSKVPAAVMHEGG